MRRPLVGAGLVGVGVVLALSGGIGVAPDLMTEARYRDLAGATEVTGDVAQDAEPDATTASAPSGGSDDTSGGTDNGGSGAGSSTSGRATSRTRVVTRRAASSRDWSEVVRRAPAAAAWVRVGNTTVDYPVASLAADMPDTWYLSHDVWDQPNPCGCPFLDRGVSVDGPHPVIYAHRLGMTQRMFYDLDETYEQSRLAALGDCTLSSPDTGDTTLTPAFAMSVRRSDDSVRATDFASVDELRAWLVSQLGRASARTEGADYLVAHATRAVSLVTCSFATRGISSESEDSQRTVTVFVTTDADQASWAGDE